MTVAEGRVLAVCEWGDPGGAPLFFLHGTPGSRMLRHVDADESVDVYRDRHLRVVTYDRPGYGASTRRPGRRVVDEAEHVEAIADTLGLHRFGVAGASGGVGPALAAAAKLPDRVGRCLLSVAPAPFIAAGPDFFAGLGDEAREWYELVDLEGPALEAVLQRNFDDIVAFLETVLPTLDLTAAVREMFAATIREAVRPGPGGVWDDQLSDINDWGFDVAEVVTPVLLQQAEDDESVPPGHTDWWLHHLRDARVTWLPGGHLGASSGAEERRRGEMELDGLAWAARTG